MLANVALPLVAFASSAFALPTHQLEPRAGTNLTGPNVAPKWAQASQHLNKPFRKASDPKQKCLSKSLMLHTG